MDNINKNILIIDDDEFIQAFLKKKLQSDGYSVTTVSTAEAGLLRLKSSSDYDLILSDLKMPRISGLDFISQLKAMNLEIPVVLITAHGSLDSAISAMREGAFDYILKPINIDELRISVERAIRFKRLEQDNTELRTRIKDGWKSFQMIGKSQAMEEIFSLVARVAPTHANVLINGESGTGKELVARALHAQSQRSQGPFVAINCSALPAELLESELFGHAKGAFTGAHQAKLGLFEEANSGTLFLDEIGDMDLPLQAKLLRVLQERKIRPVGENTSRDIDVRIIAATHKNLRAAIQEGRFREDLFYRLCVIPVELPALRQRKEDILILAEHFLRKYTLTHGLSITGFTPQAISKLLNYPWPGNVRELENVIERCVILSTQNKITEQDLPFSKGHVDPGSFLENHAKELRSLKEIERRYIGLVLEKAGGKKEKAAQILGIDRKTLRRKLTEILDLH